MSRVQNKNINELKSLHGEGYVQRYLKKPVSRITRLKRYMSLNPQDIIADFGCGTGMLAWVIHEEVKEYHGVDFSSPFIREARKLAAEKKVVNATFHQADIVEFCRARPNTFDAAFTLDFSEHLYDSQFMEIYAAIRDALRPGGKLYLHTPNGKFWLEALRNAGILPQRPEHVAVRDGAANLRILSSLGFEIDTFQYIPHYVFPLNHLHFLARLPGLREWFGARIFLICRKPKDPRETPGK